MKKPMIKSGETPGAEHQKGTTAQDRGPGPIRTPLDKGHIFGQPKK